MLRIAHFTDIHITEAPGRVAWRDLCSKRFLGWVNLAILGRFALHRDALQITQALVRDLERAAPDHIVSSGDFTGLSLASEFAAARQVLAPILNGATGVTVIPGNHDVYVRSAERRQLYESCFGPWIRTDLERAEFPAEAHGLYPYPLLRFLGDEAVLLCLKDVHATLPLDSSGRAGKPQLTMLETLLRDPRVRARTKILVLHYGLRRADGSPDKWLHRLRDAEAVLELAERAGVALILHGHIHRRYVLASGRCSAVAMANPGSLTSSHGPQAYHVVTVDGGSIRLEARRYDRALGEFLPWPDAPGAGIVAPGRAATIF